MKDWRILSLGHKIFTTDDRFDLVQDENPVPNTLSESKPQQSHKPQNYFSFAKPNNKNEDNKRYFFKFSMN